MAFNIKKLGGTRKAKEQGKLIHADAANLIDKETSGTLSDDDMKKFVILIGREPKRII